LPQVVFDLGRILVFRARVRDRDDQREAALVGGSNACREISRERCDSATPGWVGSHEPDAKRCFHAQPTTLRPARSRDAARPATVDITGAYPGSPPARRRRGQRGDVGDRGDNGDGGNSGNMGVLLAGSPVSAGSLHRPAPLRDDDWSSSRTRTGLGKQGVTRQFVIRVAFRGSPAYLDPKFRTSAFFSASCLTQVSCSSFEPQLSENALGF